MSFFNKLGFGKNHVDTTIHENLPLGLRHGGIITFDGRILNFAYSQDFPYNLQVRLPEENQEIIGFSQFDLNGYKYYRFYFSENESFLEIVCEDKKPIQGGIKFFIKIDEEFPSTADDLNRWLPPMNIEEQNDSTWWIGNPFFPLRNQEIDEEWNWINQAYQRNWLPGSEEVILPEEIHEKVCYDLEGNSSTKVTHQCMLYARLPPQYIESGEKVPDNVKVEWLFVTAETQQECLSIKQFAGITLNESNFEII